MQETENRIGQSFFKDGKSYLSDWSEYSVSADKKPKIPIYPSRNKKGGVSKN